MRNRLKALIYSYYVLCKTHVAERRRWRLVTPREQQTKVYYGHDCIPLPGEKAGGGIVKCQDLQRLFPNTQKNANTLYLVSSALPPCPKLVVQYAKKKGVKIIVNQNGVAIPAYHGNNLEVINEPRRYLLQHADHVIYQSNYCKESSDKFLVSGIASFSILHNPVDTTFFTMRGMDGMAPCPKLLMAGSHGRFYRVSSAVDIVAVLAQAGVKVELDIAGRLAWRDDASVCESELVGYCRKKGVGDRVFIKGAYSQVEAPKVFQQADILLHTQYNDACPRVIVEAISSGLPVVYSASGGVPELVGDKAGIGVDVPSDWDAIHVPDPARMAAAIMQIMISYRKYSHVARERAEKLFDLRPWLAQHERLFQKLRQM